MAAFRGDGYQHLGEHETDFQYGCPLPGSKTEYRGQRAMVHISTEVVDLCNFIKSLGAEQPDGTYAILFGTLFQFYTRISDKLVGILMRARRQGLVTFEGEMLYQRQDEHVVIRLVKEPEELIEKIEQRKEELKKHPTKSLESKMKKTASWPMNTFSDVREQFAKDSAPPFGWNL